MRAPVLIVSAQASYTLCTMPCATVKLEPHEGNKGNFATIIIYFCLLAPKLGVLLITVRGRPIRLDRQQTPTSVDMHKGIFLRNLLARSTFVLPQIMKDIRVTGGRQARLVSQAGKTHERPTANTQTASQTPWVFSFRSPATQTAVWKLGEVFF